MQINFSSQNISVQNVIFLHGCKRKQEIQLAFFYIVQKNKPFSSFLHIIIIIILKLLLMNPLMSCAIPSGFEKKNCKTHFFLRQNQNFFRVIFCTCIFIRIFPFYAILQLLFKLYIQLSNFSNWWFVLLFQTQRELKTIFQNAFFSQVLKLLYYYI